MVRKEAVSSMMKVEGRKRSISIQYDNPLLAEAEAEAILGLSLSTNKKLRRLPHVFSRVLQLPFRSDADVSVEEAPHCFRFVAENHAFTNVEAHTLRIHPGIIKIVVRESASLHFSLDDLDIWRFRLPESTRPELATAVLVDGELIVTVPKDDDNNMWSGVMTIDLN